MSDNFGPDKFSNGPATGGEITIYDDQGNNWPNTTGILVQESDFTITQLAPGIVSLQSKPAIGTVVSFRVRYNQADTVWDPNNANIPGNQDWVPPGTYRLVGGVIREISLTYGVANDMALSIQNTGSAPLEDYEIAYDAISGGGPSLFIDGGHPTVAPFTGQYLIESIFTYSTFNPVTGHTGPFSAYTSDIVITAGNGQGYGEWVLDTPSNLTTVTGGIIDLEIFLRKVL